MPAISIIKRRIHRYTLILLFSAMFLGGVFFGGVFFGGVFFGGVTSGVTNSLINSAYAQPVYIPTKEELAAGQVEIIAGDNKTVFEYRVNGRLLMIKIVPKLGATYYMVPADGQPHFDSLDHKKKLYPQWRIIEF